MQQPDGPGGAGTTNPPDGPDRPDDGAEAGARSRRDVTLAQYRRWTLLTTIAGVLLIAWGAMRLLQAQPVTGVLLVAAGFVVGLSTMWLRVQGTPAPYVDRDRDGGELWSPRVLHFYTRQGCTLCDEARARLDPVLAGKGITLVAHDVDKDAVLRRRYGARVPVAVYEGDVVFALEYDEDAVRVLR